MAASSCRDGVSVFVLLPVFLQISIYSIQNTHAAGRCSEHCRCLDLRVCKAGRLLLRLARPGAMEAATSISTGALEGGRCGSCAVHQKVPGTTSNPMSISWRGCSIVSGG